MRKVKQHLNLKAALVALGLGVVLIACADEELSPVTVPAEVTPEAVLQPAEEVVATPAAGESTAPPAEGYPAPEEETVAETAPSAYPAADEPATQSADEPPARPEGYPAPETDADGDAAPVVLGETETYVVVADQSSAQYEVDEEFFNRDVQFVTAIGTTNEIDGALVLDLSGPVPVIKEGLFVVDISTLTSDSRRRDDAIRREWLESSLFPEASFMAREVAAFPDSYVPGESTEFQLIGDLTIRDITNEVTWDVVAQLDGPTLTATATTFIFMVDYGFEPPNVFNILEVTDGVTVTVDLTAAVP